MATTSKKTTSKTTASKAAASKAIDSTPNAISMSVEFMPDDADKELLEAIEEELGSKQYSNFSDLCKEALKEFLFESELSEVSAVDDPIGRMSIQFQQQLTNIATTVNQSLAEMQQQLHQVEQTLATQDSTKLNQFEHQLTRLEQQIERLETTNAALTSNPPLEGVTPQEAESPLTQPVAESSRISDPLLLRLSALLEEF